MSRVTDGHLFWLSRELYCLHNDNQVKNACSVDPLDVDDSASGYFDHS